MSDNLVFARLLFQQSRYDLAEQELRRQLASEPDNPAAHSLLAMALAFQKNPEKREEALAAAREGVSRAPGDAFAHHALGCVYARADDLGRAEEAAREALRLDPEEAPAISLLASILLERGRWEEARQMAERGLELNPEDESCANLRARALTQLGRRDEAARTIAGALQRNPQNAFTHANQGWTLLDKGDYAQALEHFREALRLNPNMDWARQGVIEALKARNPVYRVMLNYFLFMSKLGGRARWAVIIIAYIACRIAMAAADVLPKARYVLWPLVGLYLVFCYLTWTSRPLSNLLLRLNRFGRLALSRDQTVASNWTGGLACFGLAGLVFAFFALREERLFWPGISALLLGAWCLIMVVPVAGTFSIRPGRSRRLLALYTAALGATGLVAIIGAVSLWSGAMAFATTFFIGFLVFGIIANVIAARR